MKKNIVTILVLIILVTGGVYLVGLRYYPVAVVDWRLITLKAFNDNYKIASHYYQKFLETYSPDDLPKLKEDKTKEEIKRAVLDNLIIDKIVYGELENYLSVEDIGKMVKEKLLAPLARQEILEGRLLLESTSSAILIDGRLREITSKKKVMIFLPGFFWDGNKVVIE